MSSATLSTTKHNINLMKMNTMTSRSRPLAARTLVPKGLPRLASRPAAGGVRVFAAAPAGFEMEEAARSSGAAIPGKLEVVSLSGVPTTMKGLGSSGAGATMQRSKISFKRKLLLREKSLCQLIKRKILIHKLRLCWAKC